MELYVYSDESGVFDKVHNEYFTYGGLIFLNKEDRDIAARKYRNAESCLKLPNYFHPGDELKACRLSNKNKGKLFRSLNGIYKFGCVVNQRQVLDRIFVSKKDKQRYLDYAYKIATKRAFEKMIASQVIDPAQVHGLFFFTDEHSTATNGCYELHESLEQEFKHGTYNRNYSTYYPPIFPELQQVIVSFCNSEKKPLVRAADITANKLFHAAISGSLKNCDKFFSITQLP